MLGFGIQQEDPALLAHAAGDYPSAVADLQQVFRLVQAADEIQPHGRRAGRRLGAGVRHAGRLLCDGSDRQSRQYSNGAEGFHGVSPVLEKPSAYLAGGKVVVTLSATSGSI